MADRTQELLGYIVNQFERMCQQFETRHAQVDLDFVYWRTQELLSILARCTVNGVLHDMDEILETIQRVLYLLEARNDHEHGFMPGIVTTGHRVRPSLDI